MLKVARIVSHKCQIVDQRRHPDAVIAAEACPMQPTTVVDLTGDDAVVVREGRGDPAALGL